ncbi:MAG: hypothetical protein PUC45_09065 [Oscillospiraceae bacterium]|nr:hypothetical protein [Oscillospiraceae bacterium]
MTPLMNLLYDYAMDTGFTARLTTPEYRTINNLLDRLSGDLRGSLTPDAQDTFKKYHDSLQEQRQLELEAMFLAAFALCRELG